MVLHSPQIIQTDCSDKTSVNMTWMVPASNGIELRDHVKKGLHSDIMSVVPVTERKVNRFIMNGCIHVNKRLPSYLLRLL